jgi:hypothetical protein
MCNRVYNTSFLSTPINPPVVTVMRAVGVSDDVGSPSLLVIQCYRVRLLDASHWPHDGRTRRVEELEPVRWAKSVV